MKEHPKYKNWFATESGDVFHFDKLIKGCITSGGYRQTRIEGKSILLHRFVYECFIGRSLDSKEYINHLDNLGHNNSIDNLELTDAAGNSGWYWANKGLYEIVVPDMSVKEQRQNSQAKLSREQAKELILLTLEGKTNKELSDLFNLHERYISLVRHKKRWRKIWIELGLEASETIPSGSREQAFSKWRQS